MRGRIAPNSHDERKALHEQLLKFATIAAHNGTTKGLAKLVFSFDDSDFRSHLMAWLEKFTPVRWRRTSDGYWESFTPNWEGYDLGGARLNPYYTFQPIKSSKPVSEVLPQRRGSSTVQLSDREFERKTLRLALEKFLSEGSVEARENLLQLIAKYETAGGRRSGQAFVQGGAPGLGRKR